MDETQQPPATPPAPHDEETAPGLSRGRTILLWVGVAALVIALLGTLMIVLRSLQADRALAKIGKSATSAVAQTPAAEPAPAPLAPAAQAPIAPAGIPSPAAPAVAPYAAPPSPAQARPMHDAGREPAVASRAPEQRKAERPVRRTQTSAKTQRQASPKLSHAEVERRLARCKDFAGEAAASCFRKACHSYAWNAPICVNDRRQ